MVILRFLLPNLGEATRHESALKASEIVAVPMSISIKALPSEDVVHAIFVSTQVLSDCRIKVRALYDESAFVMENPVPIRQSTLKVISAEMFDHMVDLDPIHRVRWIGKMADVTYGISRQGLSPVNVEITFQVSVPATEMKTIVS